MINETDRIYSIYNMTHKILRWVIAKNTDEAIEKAKKLWPNSVIKTTFIGDMK